MFLERHCHRPLSNMSILQEMKNHEKWPDLRLYLYFTNVCHSGYRWKLLMMIRDNVMFYFKSAGRSSFSRVYSNLFDIDVKHIYVVFYTAAMFV